MIIEANYSCTCGDVHCALTLRVCKWNLRVGPFKWNNEQLILATSCRVYYAEQGVLTFASGWNPSTPDNSNKSYRAAISSDLICVQFLFTKWYFKFFPFVCTIYLPSSSPWSSFSLPQRATTRSQTRQVCSAASLNGPEAEIKLIQFRVPMSIQCSSH